MPKLMLLFALALVGSVASFHSPAVAAETTVGPPQTYFHGNLGLYTVKTEAHLRLDRGDVEAPDAVGEENLSWDVEVLRTDMRATSRPAWRPARTGTTQRWHSFPVGSGRIICIRARQHSWGVTSAWSRLTCVVRARDDEHLSRTGPVRVVPTPGYADGRASVIRPRGALVIGGVPAGALYGPVYTDHGIRADGSSCADPSWKIAGQGEPGWALGIGSNWLRLPFHRTSVAGTAVIRSPYGRSCPVGGFVVVPRWMPR